MAGCYGPRTMISYGVECPFCVHRSRSFFRPVHQVSKRMQSRMHSHCNDPSFPRTRESSECRKATPIRRRKMPGNPPGMHRNCIQICTKQALMVHSWRVSKAPRAPCRTGNQRWYCVIPAQAGIQRLSEASPIRRRRMPGNPPECPGIAFKHALIVHWRCVPKTPRHPTGQTTQRSNSVIPAQAGIPLMSETDPNSAPTDAREPSECTGNACKHARNRHSWCTGGAFRRLHGTLQDRPPSDAAASFPRRRGSRGCQKRPRFGAEGCPGTPRNAPGMHANMHEMCTGAQSWGSKTRPQPPNYALTNCALPQLPPDQVPGFRPTTLTWPINAARNAKRGRQLHRNDAAAFLQRSTNRRKHAVYLPLQCTPVITRALSKLNLRVDHGWRGLERHRETPGLPSQSLSPAPANQPAI